MHGWRDSGGYGSQLEKRRRASEERGSSGGKSSNDDWGSIIFRVIMIVVGVKLLMAFLSEN